MAEHYVKRTHTEHAILDIGQDTGALVVYARAEFCGAEIEISPIGNNSAQRTHTAIWERKFNGRTIFAGIFPALREGAYTLWSVPPREVTIEGGRVAEVDIRESAMWPRLPDHPHRHAQYDAAMQDLLPPRYRNGKGVCASPMGAAPLKYTPDGQVAWDEIWTDFCDLALAGGPPHRGTLLEPVDPKEVLANPEAYEHVVAEIARGLRMVTELSTVRGKPGWLGLQCENEEMAHWMLRAIIVENVCVRREGNTLFFPAGPDFRLEKEIKNVVTVVAKTYHYWKEHLL